MVRAKMLAEAIPAVSYATGANVVSKFNDFGERNFDMPAAFRELDGSVPVWPKERDGEWLHGDMHRVALPYLHLMYKRIVEPGHEAPESGYERLKRMRKSIWTRKGLRPQQPGYVEYERANEVRKGLGYYIRIRTELDETGKVISAYYGKIYGEFDFYGSRPGGSFVTADAYYLNPDPNDRNVEAVPGETLLEGVSRLDLPNRP